MRNISPLWTGHEIQSKKELGIPENVTLIILQGAGINVERGAEEAVEAMKSVDGVLMIVGDGDVVPNLKKYVADHTEELSEKVLFFGRKPYNVMMNYTTHADIGLTLDKPNSLNYKLSLPNKIFDYMHTNTAVVATEIKEVANVVRTHKIGIVLEEFTVDQLGKTLNDLIKDQAKLNEFKANCVVAAKTENWEKETEVLAEIYPTVE